MADKQVRIDLVAEDNASAEIKQVADLAGKLEDLDPVVDVNAETKPAQRSVDELLKTVQHLSDEDATVVLALRAGRVQNELVETLRTVEDLDASDPQVSILLQNADTARADLDKLETAITDINKTKVAPKVDSTGIKDYTSDAGKAEDATKSFVGNAVSEIPGVADAFGPLGEAAGQVTEGLLGGEIALRGLATAALPMAGVTIAMKGLADHAKKVEEVKAFNKETVKGWASAYREAAGDVNKMTDAMGDLAEAAGEIKVSLGEAVGLKDFTDDIAKAGLTADQFFKLVAEGQDAIIEWGNASKDAGVSTEAVDGAVTAAVASIQPYNDAIKAGKVQQQLFGDSSDETSDAMARQTKKADELADATDHARLVADKTGEAFDAMRKKLNMKKEVEDLGIAIGAAALTVGSGAKVAADDILSMKQSIIDVAETAGATPIEVQSVLERLDHGDFNSVYNQVQTWANQKPVTFTLKARLEAGADIRALISGGGGRGNYNGSFGPNSATVVVNQTFPRGFRTSSAIAEAQRAAGRAGRIYMRGHLPR